MTSKMTAFFKPMPKASEPEIIHWKIRKAVPDTTALLEVAVKARIGSYVMHTVHGKVTLVGQPAPDKLEIEYKEVNLRPHGGITTQRVVVDAVECANPTAVARARDKSVYMASVS